MDATQLSYNIPSLTTERRGREMVTSVEAQHVRPGMILGFWPDRRVEVLKTPARDEAGRVEIGGFAFDPVTRIKVAGWFNA